MGSTETNNFLFFFCRSADKNPLFTKLGDNGKSKIYHAELHKNHVIFEAIGVTEELSACIG